jgi:hypothetical protein
VPSGVYLAPAPPPLRHTLNAVVGRPSQEATRVASRRSFALDHRAERSGSAPARGGGQGRARDSFGEGEGRRPWARFTLHSAPKLGSWLNPAEFEASLWPRRCRGRYRSSNLDELSRARAWNTHANRSHDGIDWRFTTADARRVFG